MTKMLAMTLITKSWNRNSVTNKNIIAISISKEKIRPPKKNTASFSTRCFAVERLSKTYSLLVTKANSTDKIQDNTTDNCISQ